MIIKGDTIKTHEHVEEPVKKVEHKHVAESKKTETTEHTNVSPRVQMRADSLTAVRPLPAVRDTVAAADSMHYLGVLPTVFHEPKVQADSLPKLQLVPFVSKCKLRLTRYHSMREYAPGQEARPLATDPVSNDVLVSIILLLTLVALFILSHTHKYFYQRIHDFFTVHGPQRKFIFNTVGDARSAGILIIQTVIFSGIMFFSYFVHTNHQLVLHFSPYLLLALYAAACFVYFCFKWTTYSFLGWIFASKTQTALCVQAYSTLICLMGFVLYPIVLFVVFAHLSANYLFIISLYLIVFAKILILYKWIKLFSQNFFRYLLLILYFCALEIIPCYLFYQSMIQMNNMLIKNF